MFYHGDLPYKTVKEELGGIQGEDVLEFKVTREGSKGSVKVVKNFHTEIDLGRTRLLAVDPSSERERNRVFISAVVFVWAKKGAKAEVWETGCRIKLV